MRPTDRSVRARELLNDEVMQDAFRDIREAYVAQLESTPIGNVDMQHEIAITLQLLARLKHQLALYGQDKVIDNHRKQSDSYIERIRQVLSP